jgi:hypothetical protein
MKKNQKRVSAQEENQKRKEEKQWMKYHPIIMNESGKHCIINTKNLLQDYDDARKEELEQFENFKCNELEEEEEREDFVEEDYYFERRNGDEQFEIARMEEQQQLIVFDDDNNHNYSSTRASILHQIEILQMKLKFFKLPDDDQMPFSNQCLSTKGEFAREFSAMCSILLLNSSAQETILAFMKKFNPYQSLPIKTSNTGKVISTVKQYVAPSNRCLKFDSCEEGCVVFTKQNQNLRRCPNCNLERYNKCILVSCKSRPYDDCPHSDIGREAKKYLYYRPIIPLLITLLEKPDFILALNYKLVKQIESNYEDVQDGQHYKENYSEMDTIYEEFCRKNPSQQWIKINILLSQFYDGVKIYDHKVVDYWPLIVTILNLPPTLRNLTGVGTFLLSIFSNSLNSAAEKFLFENCFIEELLELNEGLTINNKYFVQVRLIQHCLDTKAMGKQLNTHEANSLAGCPSCNDLPGSSRHTSFHKVVYSGFRILLPKKNILRVIGRSKLCCPPGFYGLSCTEDELEKHRNNNIGAYNAYSANLKKIQENLKVNFIAANKQRLMKRKQYIISCIPNSEEDNLSMQNFYLDETPTDEPFYQWFHSQQDDTINPYHHSKFSGNMYFVHCDLRPVRDLTRRTQAEFAFDGMLADRLSNRIPIKDRHVNGVKGSWPFTKLPYANVKKQHCYDGFHCLFGIAKHIVSLTKGYEKSIAGLTQYCKETKTFPFLYDTPPNYPWVLTPVQQSKVDAWIDAILIPKSYSGTFQIDRLYAATGFVRGKSFIDVFAILINYLNLAMPTIPEAYRNFFSMLGSEFRDILAFTFNDRQVEEMHYKIIETLCVYEGLFSERECTFIFHEFLHLSRHIPIMGPLHNWWTFSGERTMSFIKQFVPIGGKSFDKTCMNAYNNSEAAITEKAFSNKFFESDVRFSFNENNQQLEFDFKSYYFFSPTSFKKPKFISEFSDFEQECLVNILLSEIIKIADNHINALQISSFYRLFYVFKKTTINNNSNQYCTFIYWLYLVSLFDDNNGYKNNVTAVPLSDFDKVLLTTLEPYIEGSLNYYLLNNNDNYDCILRNEIKTATSIVEFLEYQKNFKIYSKAIISGNRFSARDQSYAEKDIMIRDSAQYGSTSFRYKSRNNKNNLQLYENWSMTDDHSSWCRYRLTISSVNINKNYEFNSIIDNVYYGRLNYFFRIHCETDDILHGLGMANVAPRVFEKYYMVHRISGDEYITMPNKEATTAYCTFIPVTNIYPTPILVSPFDIDGLPIVVKHKKNMLKKNQYSATTKLSYFLVNDLKPSEVLNEEQQKIFNKTKFKVNNNFSKDKK